MDMGFNHDAWPQSQGQGAESGAVNGRFDWHGLRARFLAAQAFRQAHEVNGQPVERAAGASFDRSTAQALAHFENALHGINLEDSADGKGPVGMEEDVTDASKLGDRG